MSKGYSEGIVRGVVRGCSQGCSACSSASALGAMQNMPYLRCISCSAASPRSAPFAHAVGGQVSSRWAVAQVSK